MTLSVMALSHHIAPVHHDGRRGSNRSRLADLGGNWDAHWGAPSATRNAFPTRVRGLEARQRSILSFRGRPLESKAQCLSGNLGQMLRNRREVPLFRAMSGTAAGVDTREAGTLTSARFPKGGARPPHGTPPAPRAWTDLPGPGCEGTLNAVRALGPSARHPVPPADSGMTFKGISAYTGRLSSGYSQGVTASPVSQGLSQHLRELLIRDSGYKLPGKSKKEQSARWKSQ